LVNINLSNMSNSSDLLATILSETLACQIPGSPQSVERMKGSYAPLGPYLPAEEGSYPTTDAAMSAIALLADRVRSNDPDLLRSVGRDALRRLASRVAGALLPNLAQEPDSTKHWPLFRERLNAELKHIRVDKIHYVPVWLFIGQECSSFAIGPVTFVQRNEWLDRVEARHGTSSDWRPAVRALWAGGRSPEGPVLPGLKAGLRAVLKSPISPSTWREAFISGRRFARPFVIADADRMARVIHPDQWVACTEVVGFEAGESHRRGVLATRAALDTVRLVVPSPHRRQFSTASDSTAPLSVDRLSQELGKDLTRGWRFNRPGVSGAPGLAGDIVVQSAMLFDAAGRCIQAAVSDKPQAVHPCPTLSDRWFNAVYWYGRACTSDIDFVAIVMLVIALDVLCGGKEERGILELTARLTGHSPSDAVQQDGTTLKSLVGRAYKLRSEMAHGSVLAVHRTLDTERAQFEELASVAIREYVIKLQTYAQAGGKDDRDAFLHSLPAMRF
jgi:hypothetical protein